MLRAALADNRNALAALVAPDAKFALWRGDYASSARSPGPPGAILFAKDLKGERFEVASPVLGPVYYPANFTDCTWKMTVLFRTQVAGKGVSVEFAFRDGLVTSATGHEVVLLSGDIR